MPQIKYKPTPSFYMEKKITKAPMTYMHHHNTFEIFYTIKGEREYFIEDEFFRLCEGDIAIVPSDVLHRTDGKSVSRYLIYFSREYLERYMTEELIGALSINRHYIFRPDESCKGYLAYLFDSLYGEYKKADKEGEENDGAEADPAIAVYFQQILLLLSSGDNIYSSQKYADRRIEDIIKYINENYGSIGSIEEIADRFYISKYHLCHLFNKNLGIGLVSYLNTIKVRSACEMLARGRQSITEIATACGFNSSSYFCKVFKEEKEMSPSEYRKRRGGWN